VSRAEPIAGQLTEEIDTVFTLRQSAYDEAIDFPDFANDDQGRNA
jgi:hypothetical protein